MTFNAADVLTVPAGAIHAVRNVGSGNAAELATYVVEKREAAPHAGRVSASRFIFLLGGSDGEKFLTGDHDEPGEKRPHGN